MSSRLLKEDDVIRALHEQRCLFRSDKDAQRFAVAIEAIPSADRPQGEWEIYVVSPFDGEDCRCPKCGETGCAPYWNYCPNCGTRLSGARMKGADDE